MCFYWKRYDARLIVVGAYVDELLVTATGPLQIGMFFSDLKNFSVENLGIAHNFLGTLIHYDDELGYDIDQELTIVGMLKEMGLENAHATRIPLGDTTNGVVENDVMLSIGTT